MNPQGGGHQGEPSGEWCVAEHELEVLRLQEDHSRHGEEQHGQRDAAGGEAAVGEQADVEHRLVTTQLPDDEQQPDRRTGGKAGERRR